MNAQILFYVSSYSEVNAKAKYTYLKMKIFNLFFEIA